MLFQYSIWADAEAVPPALERSGLSNIRNRLMTGSSSSSNSNGGHNGQPQNSAIRNLVLSPTEQSPWPAHRNDWPTQQRVHSTNRCPFVANEFRRHPPLPPASSNLQPVFTNYVRPAYAPHENLWLRQQSNQEMHRRHMTTISENDPHHHQQMPLFHHCNVSIVRILRIMG